MYSDGGSVSFHSFPLRVRVAVRGRAPCVGPPVDVRAASNMQTRLSALSWRRMIPLPQSSPLIAGSVLPIRRAEELLSTLPGVIAARIIASDTGAVDEIHVLTGAEVTPKQTVRNIESALIAHLGMRVDHRKISVATSVDRGGSKDAAAGGGGGDLGRCLGVVRPGHGRAVRASDLQQLPGRIELDPAGGAAPGVAGKRAAGRVAVHAVVGSRGVGVSPCPAVRVRAQADPAGVLGPGVALQVVGIDRDAVHERAVRGGRRNVDPAGVGAPGPFLRRNAQHHVVAEVELVGARGAGVVGRDDRPIGFPWRQRHVIGQGNGA